jgi:hypothetical protein
MILSKYSNFERKPRDYYQTPLAAVKPLVPHLPSTFTFCEPCAGDGRLIDHIEQLMPGSGCVSAYDIEPQVPDIEELDALELDESHVHGCDYIITNPPWLRTPKSGYLLHRLIERWSDLRPTVLLFDADWLHTVQSSELVRTRLCKIVSIGRVKWIEDSAGTGKENCCWYFFNKTNNGITEFCGR